MKGFITLVLIISIQTIVLACTCPRLKGLNGKIAGIVSMNQIFQNTFQVEVVSKDSTGITVKILNDFYNSTEKKTLFISNMDPGYTCSHSTDQFIIGNIYLIVIQPEEMK